MIVGLTGSARSGKDTVAQYLIEKHGFKHYDFYRDVFLKEMERRGLEPTKDNASILGDTLRKEGGQGVMAKLLFPLIDADNAVITGVRSPAEVEYFREKTSKFVLFLVSAQPTLRFDRRNEKDPQTEEGFFGRDERDSKNKGMDKVFAMADYSLENSGALDDLHAQIEKVMNAIMGDN